jgi:hypothetical protein
MFKYIKIFTFIFSTTLLNFNLVGQESPRISVQGNLKDPNGIVIQDGTYTLTFKLYKQAVGGTALWSEEAAVDVAGGIYSHFLGSIVPLNSSNFSSTLFMGVRVGSYELSPRTELTYAPYALAVLETVCSGAVGDIKYSILNPTQFATVNGPCWVPMDGRSIATSKLSNILNINSIPDSGGLFLRSQEFSSSPNHDPERTNSTPILTVQNQNIQSHNHPVNDPGHSHTFTDKYRALNGTQANTGGNFGIHPTTLDSTPSQSDFVTTGITISASGSTETRPKNMNFWIYTRIN